jgi:hypothetical protein
MTIEIEDRDPLVVWSRRDRAAQELAFCDRAVARAALWLLLGALTACGRRSFDLAGLDDARANADGSAEHADATLADGDARLVTPCMGPGPDTVALYELEPGALARDTTERHPGSVRGTVTTVAGPCGMAARFGASSYVLVPPSPALDLATGSFELHARIASVTGTTIRGLLGRDADGSANPGHFQAGLAQDGTIVARLQGSSGNYYRCAPPPQANTWFRVGISFGGTPAQGFRMWVDGVEATLTGTIIYGESAVICPTDFAGGINGNANALVLAANNGRAAEGALDPNTQHHFVDGDLDHVHVRDTWIDFGAR